MEIMRTIPIVLPTDADVLHTVYHFQSVQQGISRLAFERIIGAVGEEQEPPSAIALHRLCYATVKGEVSAQLTATAIRRVAGAYRSAWRKGHSIRRPFDFRQPSCVWLIGDRGRDASFPADGTLSVWTVAGRKHIPFYVPARLRNLFDRAVRVNSLHVTAETVDLAIIRRAEDDGGTAERVHDGAGHDGEGEGVEPARPLQAWLTITVEVPDPRGQFPVGIDRGALNALVAVDCDDRVLFLSGREHQAKNERTRRVRQRVRRKMAACKAQKKDTRSTRRLLKRLNRKQQNRTRTFAQQAALALCRWAPAGAVFALEDLRLPAAQPARRDQVRGRLTGWFHGLLGQCIKNKAQERGIALVSVSAAFTSLDCSQCGERGRRRGHDFLCPHCGHAEHADVNAARNIRNAAPQAGHGRMRAAMPRPA